jgi:hypothetical protein
MKPGKWLAPRYPGKDTFEKDYAKVDLNPITVACPGCRGGIKLTRTAANGRIGGWCKPCSRAVAP